MDFDFIKRLQKISLTEEEEGVIAVRGTIVNKSLMNAL